MCTPMAAVAGLQVFSQFQQTRAAAATARYNARVAENDAQRARAAGAAKEMDIREQTSQLISRQRAQLGAAGVEIDAGSAAGLQASTELRGEVDALRVRAGADQQVEALTSEAGLLRSRASSLNQAATVGLLGGAASIGYGQSLQSGGRAAGRPRIYADKWYRDHGRGASSEYPVG